MNRRFFTILFLLTLLFTGAVVQQCYAAFPVRQEAASTSTTDNALATDMEEAAASSSAFSSVINGNHYPGHRHVYKVRHYYYGGYYQVHHPVHFRYYHGERTYDNYFYERRGYWYSTYGVLFFWTGITPLLSIYYSWRSMRTEDRKFMAFLGILLAVAELAAMGVIFTMFI